MLVRGLDGATHALKLGDRRPEHGLRPRSAGHRLARQLLREVCPWHTIYEEVLVPGCETPLYLDFFLPEMAVAVEVQGEQHRTPGRFGKGRLAFLKAKRLDATKAEWCELNNIRLVVLHDDNFSTWATQLAQLQ